LHDIDLPRMLPFDSFFDYILFPFFRLWDPVNGDIVQNVHNFLIRSSKSGFWQADTIRVTQELV
jgi:hypothetical protein